MSLDKKRLIFWTVFILFCSYLTAGFLIFYFNGKFSILMIKEYYNLMFTYKALVSSYPHSIKAIFYCLGAYTTLAIIIELFNGSKKSLHGEARFANKREIKKMNLLSDKGLILGKMGKNLLRWNSEEFVALGAPTRSGKGVSIVIPNLMEWGESCVVLDIKQECFDFSSKYRKEILNQDVYLFNPFSFRTHRYNPLDYIDMNDISTRDNDLLDFVNLLYPIDGGGDNTTFFNQLAQNLFIGLAYLYKDLALTVKGQEFLKENDIQLYWSMSGILNLSGGFELSVENEEEEEDTIINTFDDTIEYLIHLELLSKGTKERLSSYTTMESQNTKSGVLSSFNAPLMIYRNEPVNTATSESDFDLRDLRKKKMTIYIGITPDKLAIARPILNIFFSQLLSVNTKELPQKNPDLKYTCLLLMDEFTSIGYMPILRKGVSYISGFHLRIMMIFQAISQLEAHSPDGYGKEGANTLLQNMGVKMYFTPSEPLEARKISERLGDTTVKVTSKSFNNARSILENGSSGTSVSEQKRALMLPQELIELPQDEQLLMMNYQKPILCKKSFYFNDDYFINKFKEVSPYMKSLKSSPVRKDWEIMLQKNDSSIVVPLQKNISA